MGSGGAAVIGLQELVSLPDWGIFHLDAKVDTGAKTSALHVEALELRRAETVRFRVVLDAGLGGERESVEAPLVRKGWVRSSQGVPHQRLFVRTRLVLGALERTVEIGLVDRAQMRFRMLLGRSAFENEFLVDVGRSYVLGSRAGA